MSSGMWRRVYWYKLTGILEEFTSHLFIVDDIYLQKDCHDNLKIFHCKDCVIF